MPNSKKKGNRDSFGRFVKGHTNTPKGIGGLEYHCSQCGKKSKKSPHFVKRSKNSYCSRECYYTSKRGVVINPKGSKLPFSVRKKMSESTKGENNPNWKGGISIRNSTKRKTFMNTVEYKEWRRLVFEKDNYTCVQCGTIKGFE